MENSALIISCQHGDLKSFAELYKIYSKNALGTAYLIAGSKGIAEDIVQETFIECWKSFQRLQNPATFEVWFYKILVRTGWRMVKRYNLTIPMDDDSLDGVVESVRTVFVLDKNEQVVEKSSDQVFITPAVTLNTELSDTALSKKMGIHVRFPQILNGNYKLQRKAEAVGFSLPLGYETFNDLQLKAEEAINNQEAFNSLKEYKPYRSVGGVYKNEAGLSFGLVIQDKSIPLSTENIKFTTTTAAHINDLDATWKGLSYPNYPDNDMTQKPDGIITTHILMWSKDNATYIILPLGNSNLSMQAVVSQAEAFMNAQ